MLSNKIFTICTFLFFITIANARLEAQSGSGVLRGSFVIDNSSTNRRTEQNSSTRNVNPTQNQNNSSSSGNNQNRSQNNNSGTTSGSFTANNSNNNSSRSNSPSIQRNGQNTNANNGRRNTPVQNDDISYKKIYFVIIAAFVLFLYLIFGMKRKNGRRKSNISNSNRYLK